MDSLAEPKGVKRCVSCGSTFGDKAFGGKAPNLSGEGLLCVDCTVRMRAEGTIGYRLPTRDDSPLPVEERFDELFRAANVLLREDAKENEVIPTLALANEIGQGRPRLIAEKERFAEIGEESKTWDEEAHKFARHYGGLRPARIVQGTLILERRTVLVAVGYALTHKTPVDVMVTVYPHRTRLAASSEVATEYGKVLSATGIACDEQRTGHLSYSFYNGRLEITIRPGAVTQRVAEPQPGWRSDEASFPDPRYVGTLCGALVEQCSARGFSADLPTRKLKKVPMTENLVPACVAFLLKEYGMRPVKAINSLLYDCVLDDAWKAGREPHEIAQFRGADKGSSLHEQLWGNTRKDSIVRDPLIDAAWTLFWEGYEE